MPYRKEHGCSGCKKRPTLASHMSESTTGYVSEIFCSIQGEGIYVGERQVFVRTAGCSATCYWCDTVGSKNKSNICVVHGAGRRTLPNPLTLDQTLEAMRAVINENRPVHTISITGGEPLEQPRFVAGLAHTLKQDGFRIYLDTNGYHFEAMASLVSLVDVVAMDIKLPSATGEDNWERHRRFLTGLAGVEAYVKIVVDSGTPLDELEQAVRVIAGVDKNIPLVLQPEGMIVLNPKKRPGAMPKLIERLEKGQRFALEHLRDVRIVPQCHRILKVK